MQEQIVADGGGGAILPNNSTNTSNQTSTTGGGTTTVRPPVIPDPPIPTIEGCVPDSGHNYSTNTPTHSPVAQCPQMPDSGGHVIGYGVTVTAGVIGGAETQIALVVDSSGNVGIMTFSGAGAVVPSVSVTGDAFVVWGADTIYDLGFVWGHVDDDRRTMSHAFSGTGGVSATVYDPFTVGVNVIHGREGVTGAGVSVGVGGGPPVSVRYLIGISTVIPLFNIVDVFERITGTFTTEDKPFVLGKNCD